MSLPFLSSFTSVSEEASIPLIKANPRARFGSTYTKIGTIQRLAWSLCKDDTQINEVFHIFIV